MRRHVFDSEVGDGWSRRQKREAGRRGIEPDARALPARGTRSTDGAVTLCMRSRVAPMSTASSRCKRSTFAWKTTAEPFTTRWCGPGGMIPVSSAAAPTVAAGFTSPSKPRARSQPKKPQNTLSCRIPGSRRRPSCEESSRIQSDFSRLSRLMFPSVAAVDGIPV